MDNFSGNLILSLESDDGTKFWTKNENVNVSNGINVTEKIDINSDELIGKYFIKGLLKDNKGKIIYESKIPVNIYDSSSIEVKKNLYVLESNNRLANYLNNKGVSFDSYSNQIDGQGLVSVGQLNDNSDNFISKLEKVKQFISSGGNALYLDYKGKFIVDRKARKLPETQFSDKFPIGMAIINTNGLWQSTIHMLKYHPLF